MPMTFNMESTTTKTPPALVVVKKRVAGSSQGQQHPSYHVQAGSHLQSALRTTSAGLHQAVIGAGAAGLVTARELSREGHSVTVFEQNTVVGGVWKYAETVEDDLLGLDPNRERVHSSLCVS